MLPAPPYQFYKILGSSWRHCLRLASYVILFQLLPGDLISLYGTFSIFLTLTSLLCLYLTTFFKNCQYCFLDVQRLNNILGENFSPKKIILFFITMFIIPEKIIIFFLISGNFFFTLFPKPDCRENCQNKKSSPRNRIIVHFLFSFRFSKYSLP